MSKCKPLIRRFLRWLRAADAVDLRRCKPLMIKLVSYDDLPWAAMFFSSADLGAK